MSVVSAVMGAANHDPLGVNRERLLAELCQLCQTCPTWHNWHSSTVFATPTCRTPGVKWRAALLQRDND